MLHIEICHIPAVDLDKQITSFHTAGSSGPRCGNLRHFDHLLLLTLEIHGFRAQSNADAPDRCRRQLPANRSMHSTQGSLRLLEVPGLLFCNAARSHELSLQFKLLLFHCEDALVA